MIPKNRYNAPKPNSNKKKLRELEKKQEIIISKEQGDAFYDMCSGLADLASAKLTLSVAFNSPYISDPVKKELSKFLNAISIIDLNLTSVLGLESAKLIKDKVTDEEMNQQLKHVKRLFIEAEPELRDHLETVIEEEVSSYKRLTNYFKNQIEKNFKMFSHLLDKKIVKIINEKFDDEIQNRVTLVELENKQKIKLYGYINSKPIENNQLLKSYVRYLTIQPIKI